MSLQFDERDEQLRQVRIVARANLAEPLVGDYVLFPGGELERFSHAWETGLQTSAAGSFHIFKDGNASFSGGLNPSTPRNQLVLTGKMLPGTFWFFHHDEVGAHRGVYCTIPCKVYTTSAPYTGFIDQECQRHGLHDLKAQLAQLLSQ